MTARPAGELFADIASHAETLRRLLRAAIVAEPADADAMCGAGAALADRIGYIADCAAKLCSGEPGIQSEEEWLLSEPARQALLSLHHAMEG